VLTARNPKVFILGETTRHPGLLYYPLNLVFRMTPLALVGLGLVIVRGRRRAGALARFLAMFAVVLLVALSAIEKKSWRYVSLVLPAVDVLAALGLVAAAGALAARIRPVAAAIGLAALLAAQGVWVASRAPYYGLAINPLLGGSRVAVHAVRLSTSEGLRPAVEFLASEAERLGRPITWSGGYTGPDGSAGEKFAPETVTWIGRDPTPRADYHVLCLAYVQRGKSRLEPGDAWWKVHGKVVRRIRIDGVDLVTIYARRDDR
jgi:hypothetical protein